MVILKPYRTVSRCLRVGAADMSMLAFLKTVDEVQEGEVARSDEWFEPVVTKLRLSGFLVPRDLAEGCVRSCLDSSENPPLLGPYPAFLGRVFRVATQNFRDGFGQAHAEVGSVTLLAVFPCFMLFCSGFPHGTACIVGLSEQRYRAR